MELDIEVQETAVLKAAPLALAITQKLAIEVHTDYLGREQTEFLMSVLGRWELILLPENRTTGSPGELREDRDHIVEQRQNTRVQRLDI